MKLFVILATVIAYTSASPIHELLHPSPVNPDVLVAIKPKEKIILITDPKEIAKFKRETRHPFYPTVLPKTNEHHIAKRDYTISHQTPVAGIKEQQSHAVRKQELPEDRKILVFQGPLTLPLKESTPSTEQHKRDIPVPLVPKHHHPEEFPKENSEIKSDVDRSMENLEHNKGNKILKQLAHKRDIPVPLVPKYHHPEESPKDSNEQENLKSNTSKIQQISEEQKQDSIGQQKSQAFSRTTDGFSQTEKRESPISSIPKHESPKDVTLQHDKKEVKTEHFESSQASKQSPVWHHDHHIEGNEKESNDRKSERNEHSPVVQDASYNISSNQNDQKPPIHNDSLSASDSRKSATEHPLVRLHPVPVAELFARNHGN